MTESLNEQNSKLVGLLAQFDDPDSLLHACDRDATGRLQGDGCLFAVPGPRDRSGDRDQANDFAVYRPDRRVGSGRCRFGNAVVHQWWLDFRRFTAESPLFPGYAFKISGKPYFSLPANIPVTFEVIVLSSAFATFFGMWIMNSLPRLSNPLHRVSRFKRVTNDKFFLMIETRDPKFHRDETEQQLTTGELSPSMNADRISPIRNCRDF